MENLYFLPILFSFNCFVCHRSRSRLTAVVVFAAAAAFVIVLFDLFWFWPNKREFDFVAKNVKKTKWRHMAEQRFISQNSLTTAVKPINVVIEKRKLLN